jgi:chromosome segregation ATPase
VSQEKAAARESELLEEIRALQKAKATDKQQWQAQMIQLNEEAAEALRKVKLIEIERDEAIKKMNAALEASLTWEDRETELLAEIDELKSGTLQGVQSLREELEREREINRNLRSEHQSILRQNEQRLHELETQSANSMRALTEKEHELMSMRAVLGQAGGPKDFNQLVRELDSAKTDIDNLNKQIDEQKDICQKLERRTRQAEAELKANQLRWEDERNRFHELLTLSDARIIELQDKLKQLEILNKDIPSNEDSNAGSTNNKMAQLMEQIQSLSKQLLKKQEQAMEQQAEKSVLKSRINDLLTRYLILYKTILFHFNNRSSNL